MNFRFMAIKTEEDSICIYEQGFRVLVIACEKATFEKIGDYYNIIDSYRRC